MTAQNSATFDTLRVVANGVLSTSYVAISPAFTSPAVAITFKNDTDATVYVSTDGTNDMLAYSASTYGVYDIRTNAPNLTDFLLPVGTTLYVKYVGSAPTTGSFFIEAIISKNNK